ncbi:MAG: GAF domain-containing protein [Chloroflexi bacterium]|nr:GAF domain-containing protein [Chloroflexota bacterium]
MNLDNSAIFKQLKDTCKLTKSRWVAIIEPSEDSWLLSWEYGLSKPRKNFFNKYLEESKIVRWFNQVSKVDRIRWRKLGEDGEVLGCERIYAIPNTSVSKIIVVGADSLDSISKKYFNVLSHGIQSAEVFKMSTLINLSSHSAEKHSDEFSHEPEKAFYNVLQSVNAYLPSDGGYLAVRSGDRFQVEALMGKGSSKLGAQILIEENEALARIVESRKGLILQSKNVTKGIRLGRKRGKTKDDWLIVPLLIGNRVTGIMAFYKNSFTISGLERATILAGHVAPVVEKTMIFREASHHLQNIGLLNELASVVSVGLDLKEVTQRVHRMLQRAFSSGQAELLLVSSDGKRLINADRSESSERPKEYDISATFVGLCVESGKAVRTGSVENETRYTVIDPETRSKLAVPLKFRDEVKGVLALESNEPDAFSKQEEKFLLVIASQITALIENARLNEQTLQRADRLAMINDLVQQVVGLTDQMQIAHRAATLMQNRPWFEMVVISLLDKSRDELVTMGVAGTNLPELPKEMRTAKDLGIAGKVLKSGESELILDTSKENKYFALPGWEPGSAICVALREGENVFGIINVESQEKNVFSDNDLLTLEALAGVLSSVLIYARRYDELVIAGFSFDGASQAVIQESANQRLKIHMAHIRPDVSPGMDGLLKDTPKSQLFTVFGQPEIDVRSVADSESDEVEVELIGVDIYSPLTGEITSSGASKVAAWFLDSDYDGRCFCITQAFFPNQKAWDKIAKALGSSADAEAFAAYDGTVSIPFEPGEYRRIAVKVIDPRGNEVMAIRKLEESS